MEKFHPLLYIIILQITYSCDKAVTPPVAGFIGSPTEITAGENVNFSDQSTNNPANWSWIFGDGGTSTEQNPTYNYNTPGVFSVVLTVSNNGGLDSETKTDYITVKDPNTVTDVDGNIYRTVQIGEQVWMAENLRTTHFADGAAIPYVESNSSWYDLVDDSKAYCWYDNNSANKELYGALYTWNAAMNGVNSTDDNPSRVQGVCPEGWHLPSDSEWKELEMFLGMSREEADATLFRGIDEGGKMKDAGTAYWVSPNTGATNSSGFSALPGGFRDFNGAFAYLGTSAYFWTTLQDGSGAFYRRLWHEYSESYRHGQIKHKGSSVRCVKD